MQVTYVILNGESGDQCWLKMESLLMLPECFLRYYLLIKKEEWEVKVLIRFVSLNAGILPFFQNEEPDLSRGMKCCSLHKTTVIKF